MSKLSNTYYIGRINCDENNAMMKEIAELMRGYEYSLLHLSPTVFYTKLKDEIDDICAKHKRCTPVNLQMMELITGFGFTIYACKPGFDHCILYVTLNEALNEIEP